MFNKLKFNNLVISNRKSIQLSRIQTINKLVRKIRKLKGHLEKNPGDVKFKERIRKSIEAMQFLKKIKRVDVVKKVLLMEKGASSYITNGFSTPDEIAIAFLSMNTVMQELIKRFKEELQLNIFQNNEWKEDMKATSKRRQKINRTEEKRRKRSELKQQKAIRRKRIEWLEENQQSINENFLSDSLCNVSTTGNWQIEELSNDNEKEIVHKIANKNNEKSEICIKKEPITTQTFVLEKSQREKADNNKMNDDIQCDNRLHPTKETNITDLEQNKRSTATAEDAIESLAIDTFFITDSGENYMSTATIKNGNMTGQETYVGKTENHVTKHYKYSRDHFSKNQKYLTKKNIGKSEQSKWNNKKLEINKSSQKKWNKNKQPIENTNNISEIEDLHPSWKAKQKLKPFITGFEGKKIKFANDLSKLNENEEKGYNKDITTKLRKSEECIHPSWAAKQKLKHSITEFKGKKIVFDDNQQ